MTDRLLRGRLLSLHAEPQGPGDTSAYSYIEDGALRVAKGLIVAVGDYDGVAAQAPGVPVTDHRPHLMMAGFIDLHIHFPQAQVIASWGAQLLDWLNTYTFPEEMRFADPAHAARMAALFLDQWTAHGTATAVGCASVLAASAQPMLIEAARRDMRVIAGKVMMDRNAPDGLRDTAQTGYDESKALMGHCLHLSPHEIGVTRETGARPISSCSTPAPPTRWRCEWSTPRCFQRSCSSFRSWAMTALSPRPTWRASRRNPARFQ